MIDQVRFNASCCELAKWIVFCRAQAYNQDYEWEGLDGKQKDLFIALAAEILKELQPSSYFVLAAELARRDAAKVIGRISPEQPYGISKHD